MFVVILVMTEIDFNIIALSGELYLREKTNKLASQREKIVFNN